MSSIDDLTLNKDEIYDDELLSQLSPRMKRECFVIGVRDYANTSSKELEKLFCWQLTKFQFGLPEVDILRAAVAICILYSRDYEAKNLRKIAIDENQSKFLIDFMKLLNKHFLGVVYG